MNVDKGSFLAMVAMLGAGGVGGYFVSQKVNEPRPVAQTNLQAPVERMTPPVEPTALASAVKAPAIPTCDDSVGTAADCPPASYPADEGGCGALPTARCEDYKRAFKPKVAQAAVQCLNDLKPGERCDASRLNLCGHQALMNACMASDDGSAAASTGAANGSSGSNVSSGASACDAIVKGCPSASARECNATIAGMNDLGRSQFATCMASHCADKGLLGCEARVVASQ